MTTYTLSVVATNSISSGNNMPMTTSPMGDNNISTISLSSNVTASFEGSTFTTVYLTNVITLNITAIINTSKSIPTYMQLLL